MLDVILILLALLFSGVGEKIDNATVVSALSVLFWASGLLAAIDHPKLVAAANVVDRRLAHPKLLGDLPRRQAFLSGLDHSGLIGVFQAFDGPVIGAVLGLELRLKGLGIVAIDPAGLF